MRLFILPLLVIAFIASPAVAGLELVEKYPTLFKVPPKGAEGMKILKSYCAKMGFKKGTEKNGECVLKLYTDPLAGMKIECSELGFKAGTQKHGGCVVELFGRAKARIGAAEAQRTRNAAAAHSQTQDRIAQEKIKLEKRRLEMERQQIEAERKSAERERQRRARMEEQRLAMERQRLDAERSRRTGAMINNALQGLSRSLYGSPTPAPTPNHRPRSRSAWCNSWSNG
jgi:hypothetical protein